jgi:ribosomal protein L29
VRVIRRDIARIQTIMRQNQLAQTT